MRPLRLLLFGLFLLGFGALLGLVLFPAGPDRVISSFFASEPLPVLTPAVILLTHLNSPPALALYLLSLLGFLLYRRRKREALFAATAIIGTALLNSLLKALVDRTRPEARLVPIDSPSFPSWHSSTAMALALVLWWIFVRPLPPGKRRRLLTLLCFAWPLLIGFSRLWLNVHWCSDILAGWGLGMTVTALALLALFPARESRHGAA